MGAYDGFFYNFMFSMLVTMTGGFGLFVTRLMKGNWTGQQWTYVPIFWLPIFFSWPPALTVLFGGFDT